MIGLDLELGRLRMKSSSANVSMLHAEREEYRAEPTVKPQIIARATVTAMTTADEVRIADMFKVVVEAYRNKLITEEQARDLVSRIK
jgi:hypothetical protein